jgi:hypothetical protein
MLLQHNLHHACMMAAAAARRLSVHRTAHPREKRIPWRTLYVFRRHRCVAPTAHARTHANTHACTHTHACRHVYARSRMHAHSGTHNQSRNHPLNTPTDQRAAAAEGGPRAGECRYRAGDEHEEGQAQQRHRPAPEPPGLATGKAFAQRAHDAPASTHLAARARTSWPMDLVRARARTNIFSTTTSRPTRYCPVHAPSLPRTPQRY